MPRRFRYLTFVKVVVTAIWLMLLLWGQETLGQAFSTDACYEDDIIDRRCLDEIQGRSDDNVDSLYTVILEGLEQDRQATLEAADVDSVHLQYLDRRIEGLKAAQEAWAVYRDATCNEWLYAYFGGSLARPVMIHCRIEMMKERFIHLREVYQQEP